MGIHSEILSYILEEMQNAMIDEVLDIQPEDENGDPVGDPITDPTKAGIVLIGNLQGEPGPDGARISVMLYANDPDVIVAGSPSGMERGWSDEIYHIESNGTATYVRRFSCKIRCLFADSREDHPTSLEYASTVRDRAETLLLSLPFTGVVSGNERVSRPIFAEDLKSEMLQAGGPPDQYDYLIKIRFSVLTTRTGALT
jgi:hypothetical protein